jgi:predicted nucleic acid-binding protein
MGRVTTFVDTSALVAILDADVDEHRVVSVTWRQLASVKEGLVTSNYVVVESLTLARNRLGADAARRLAQAFLPLIETRWVDDGLHRSGLETWLATGPSRVSLVDWVSFALMRAERIVTAFTLDPDFRTAGFEVIPA